LNRRSQIQPQIMTEAKVTVLMPAYNAEEFIHEAIDSVLKQSFHDFELLIVNDGSTDNTEQIIRSFNDPRIILISQTNKGIAGALNTGIQSARGEFIARFDADDICYPNRLEHQYSFMKQNPEYVLIGSDVDYIDLEGDYLYHYNNIGHSHEEIQEKIKLYCPFIHSSVFYKTELARKLGGYDSRAHTFEDYHLWIRFITKGRTCNLRTPLIAVRLNPGSVTIDEKLRGRRFIRLKHNILFETKTISLGQEHELLTILKRQNFAGFKKFGYHILVAKKYLWNSYNPAKARQNIRKAIRQRPLNPTAYGLLVLSFMPKGFINNLYKKYKTAEFTSLAKR
jgi:glycosyltransferase involved in cell wall biosynthesis